jgi:osmoprotectant transport system ATP-binding protein
VPAATGIVDTKLASFAPPRIALAGVTRSFESRVAVRNVSLSVAAGQLVAVVGESGCGKTTTLKMVNRLLDPDTGVVLIDGQPTAAEEPHRLRRRIGYVFQRVGLFPHLTVAENVGITPELLGWERAEVQQRVAELLELVQLPADFARRYPANLSGGQLQRVGVARALAARPQIMLMDEPFGALDPVTRDALGTDYRRLHERMGLTTLMVTHDVLEAALLADRIVVMRAGEIVADGTPRELMSGHRDAHVRALMDMPRRQAIRVTALLDEGDTGG